MSDTSKKPYQLKGLDENEALTPSFSTAGPRQTRVTKAAICASLRRGERPNVKSRDASRLDPPALTQLGSQHVPANCNGPNMV